MQSCEIRLCRAFLEKRRWIRLRTFIAIELEEETKAQLAEVQAEAEKLCRRGNYTPKENFHLTLHFLGEVQEEDLDYLHEAIYETARRNRPFTMTIDKIGFFPRGNKGILWAGIERSNHLQRLFSTLEKSLEQQGFARERKGLISPLAERWSHSGILLTCRGAFGWSRCAFL